MKITTRQYLYKIVEPSTKQRTLTRWTENDPIEKFETFDRIKFPLSKPDSEILQEVSEMAKNRAAKFFKLKNEALGISTQEPVGTEEKPTEE